MYSPSNHYPVCSSSYDSLTFFLNSSQEQFTFICVSETGHPSIIFSLHIKYEINGRTVQTNEYDLTTLNGSRSHVSLVYSPYLDSSFDNATLECTVSQQLPNNANFVRSCSLGPLTLPAFSISIHSSELYDTSFVKDEIIALTCTSNFSGVSLEWTYISLDDWQYNISKTDDLKLIIYNVSREDESTVVECSGSYGKRKVSQTARIYDALKIRQPDIFSDFPFFFPVVAFVTLAISSLAIITGIKVHRFKRKRRTNFSVRVGPPFAVSRGKREQFRSFRTIKRQ